MLENVGRRSEVHGGEFSRFVKIGENSLNGNERNRLFRNQGGDPPRFLDVAFAAGADRIEDGRGVVATDVDQDGDLDLVVVNSGEANEVHGGGRGPVLTKLVGPP